MRVAKLMHTASHFAVQIPTQCIGAANIVAFLICLLVAPMALATLWRVARLQLLIALF